MTTKWDTVAIVGVGLIGGSIGLALREHGLARRIVGIGRSESSLAKAKQLRTVDETTTILSEGVAQAELIVLCTPVERIAEQVRLVAASCPAGALITDAGSTKSSIAAAIEEPLPRGVRFVGSHPMAGSEQTGAAAARADLFQARPAVVTPTISTSEAAVAAIIDFWESLGANVVTMSPEQHDKCVAAISHLPHVIASALAAATGDEDLPLASSGWEDTTRIAAGDVDLWQQILLDNQTHTLKALDKFETVLNSFRRALESGNRAHLVELLTDGKNRRESMGS